MDFFGHEFKHNEKLDEWSNKYARVGPSGKKYAAFTRMPLPYYEDVEGRTPQEAVARLEGRVLREFKKIGAVLGYEFED